ncbi:MULTISPECIES: acetyltransferase [Clostridium]|uniref:acetyltransferase n=1 Tax=Clostridium TaxID=1485 RepID=UPI000E74C6E2|nr:acetyltransferase [[Clostridium] innocuum]MCQ5276472.1 acetyltransferase [Clostridium sp. DFI.1.208]RJV84279.1 transferase [Erysipelotrichaceae bacterium AF15-26LB]RJV85011.1 transferase [Erysipelotrichaceae bacterium AF19-24AC]MCC2843780.1 acetyltransferase [[Clostridium] innocuum]MCC2848039.1 acetyltransferase [[Clostridium] innocuum]
MNNIVIIGASGFGREVAWLIENSDNWNVIGFVDDNKDLENKSVNDYPVLGTIDFLLNVNEKTNAVVAIGNPQIRKKIVERLQSNTNISFPNIVDKDVIIDKTVMLGFGNIICKGNILTTNIEIGNFNHINLNCTVGHDVQFNDYITVYPGVNISGNVIINDCVEVGTGTKIIQGKKIVKETVIGAGSVVVKDIIENGTYIGIPAKQMK